MPFRFPLFAQPVGGLIVMLRLAVAVADFESVTVTVKFEVPASLGVPDIPPVLESRLSPVGNAPVSLQE